MENKQSEEVDLSSFFSGIKNGFRNFFQGLGELISFSLKNLKTLLVIMFIGIGTSIGLFLVKRTVYVSELTMSHKRLNNGQCFDLVSSITDGNTDTIVAGKLGLDLKTASQIKSISFKLNKTLSKAKENDSLLNYSDFKIEVRVYNKKILDSLQKGILNFLESNEYASKRKELYRSFLDKFEERVKNQIIAVDSLKRIVDKSILPRSMGNGIILGESVDPVKVYQESLNLFRSQLGLNEQKELNNSFEVIIGFSSAVPSSSLSFYIMAGFIISWVFGLLWLFRIKHNLGTGV